MNLPRLAVTSRRRRTPRAAPPSGDLGQTTRTHLETDLLVLLYDVAGRIRTHAEQMAREHGMARAQWIILARLERQTDLSQNETHRPRRGRTQSRPPSSSTAWKRSTQSSAALVLRDAKRAQGS
jgi:hypothetical protein